MSVDEVALNFNETSLLILNIILGFVMFGVALDLKLKDFREIAQRPRSFAIGMLCQFVLLPAITFGLVLYLGVLPSIGLGMILVASCPGGNISNFFTYLGKGNAALSIAMSAVSTAFAMVMTPLNFAFWGSRVPGSEAILSQISLDPVDMAITIFLLMGLPLAAGLLISHQLPKVADATKGPMKIFSLIFFIAFVLIALATNWSHFLDNISLVFFAVLVMNAIALGLGYLLATVSRLPEADRRAVSIEVGIQNSGLGLILIFGFFGGIGGMAIIAAWWGIWHIITGYLLGLFWSRSEPQSSAGLSAAG